MVFFSVLSTPSNVCPVELCHCDCFVFFSFSVFSFFLLSAVTSAVIFHQRALSLPSATPMLSHSPHSNSSSAAAAAAAAHLAMQKSSQSNLGSSSNFSSNPSFNGLSGGGFFGKNATGGIVVDRSIQPVHHRTRSLPLTEESAIRVAYNGMHPHQLPSGNRKHQKSSSLSIASLKCTCPSGAAGGTLPIIVVGNSSSRTSHYNLCPLHGSTFHAASPSSAISSGSTQQDYENMNKSCSYLPSTSPPDQQHYYSNHLFEATDSNHPAIVTPSRSSMESIIEDQKYLPMDMKKPSGVSQEDQDTAGTAAPNLLFISRLLRSSHLQTANNSKLAALKMATAASSTASTAGGSSSSCSNSTSSHLHGSTTGTGNGTHSYCSNSGSSLPKGGGPSGSPPGTLRRRSGRNSANSRRSMYFFVLFFELFPIVYLVYTLS